MSTQKIGLGIILFVVTISADVSFDTSMSGCKYYDSLQVLKRLDWALVQKLYQQHWIGCTVDKTGTIPRIIHQIWLSGPLPEKYERFQRSWQQHHPDWQYRLWTDADVESFGLKNKAAFDAARNWGQKSDIFRYEILQRYGGLYVDCDFECLKPFDEIHNACDFYAGVAYGAVVTLYNGLIGTCPGHPIIDHCVARISLNETHQDEFLNTLHTTGPMYFTRCFFEAIEHCQDRVVIFPVSYFYPWPDYARHLPLARIYKLIKPETVAMHHWHTAWMEGG